MSYSLTETESVTLPESLLSNWTLQVKRRKNRLRYDEYYDEKMMKSPTKNPTQHAIDTLSAQG